MMKNRLATTFGSLAILVALAGTARATVLNFAMKSDGTVPGNNQDLDIPYGSNVTAGNIIGATDGGEGFTPNIALTWAPTGGFEGTGDPDSDILEFHSAVTFTEAGFTVPVLQLDWDESNHLVLPADPTVDFTPEAGWAVRVHELRIGNASDQGGELAHPWTISVLELPSLTVVDSYTTGPLGPTNAEIATIDFTGQIGVSYRLRFNDGGTIPLPIGNQRHPRTGIDNLRFSQVVIPAGTPGDYNDNGRVDAADYVLWRNGGTLLNDPNPGNPTAQYNQWKANFGNPPGSASALGSGAVPEPSSLVLVGLALLAVGQLRRRLVI